MEREINALMPGTSAVAARQFTYTRNGVMEGMLDDPRTRALAATWIAAATVELPGQDDGRLKRFSERIAAEAKAFVVETLDLPWPWCAYGLAEAFWHALKTRRWGLVHYTADLFAAPVAVHFKTKPGESYIEALGRLTELYCQAAEALLAARAAGRSRRKRMRATEEDLTRAGRWWYEITRRRRSKRQIAREYSCDRRIVQLAIARADQLLETVPAAFYPSRGGVNIRIPPRPL